MEERLRVLEEDFHRHDGATKERWLSQRSFNSRMEEAVSDLKDCVTQISSNQRVNTVKVAAIVFLAQAVVGAIVVAIVRIYLVAP